MTVTIELKPEIEKRLAEEADKKGLPIETFIEAFIEENLEETEEKEEKKKPFHETASREEWLAEFRKWIESHKDKDYPVLPDEAYSRENIYEDRF
jgi:predicted transcriptional regulator